MRPFLLFDVPYNRDNLNQDSLQHEYYLHIWFQEEYLLLVDYQYHTL